MTAVSAQGEFMVFDRMAQYQAYNVATQTVPKTKQIVMLYDGIIRFVQQAKEAIQEKRIQDRYNLLVRASEVIVSLQACLDHENGGNIAKILHDYYASIDMRILSIHRTNSTETCDRVIAELKEMRSAWHHIDTSAEVKQPGSPRSTSYSTTDAAPAAPATATPPSAPAPDSLQISA
jgi:flagellar secretion chaperone FliS